MKKVFKSFPVPSYNSLKMARFLVISSKFLENSPVFLASVRN